MGGMPTLQVRGAPPHRQSPEPLQVPTDRLRGVSVAAE